LSTKVFKFNPVTTPSIKTTLSPIVLKTLDEIEQVFGLYAKKLIKLLTPKTKTSKLPQKKPTVEKSQKRTKDLEKEEEEESEEDWMLENDKNADQENVDHKVVDHKENLSATSDSGKELFYLVEFSPLFSENESTKWISETELFDCKELIIKYWNKE
jgi:NACalpha-BTF3-like transcription factor